MHKITLVSPFPPGRGSGGWGQKALTWQKIASAARASPRGCKGRSLPASQRRAGSVAGVPGAPAPGKIKQKSPPSRREGGQGDGGRKALTRQKKPMPRGLSRRGAGGASPPGKPAPPGFSPGDARGGVPGEINLWSPPSPEGKGGRGDGGKKIN